MPDLESEEPGLSAPASGAPSRGMEPTADEPYGTGSVFVEEAGAQATAEPEPPHPARRSARGAILVGARIVAGTVGVVVAAATVAAAGLLPLPTVAHAPVATSVVPVPADQQRVCAGPILRLGSDTGEEATVASSIGTPRVDYAATEGTASATRLQSTDSTTGITPTEITLPPAPATVSGGVPVLAASQTQSVDHGDIAGFSAAECREASGDTWLVGGATTTGRTTLITMSNPGEVIANVDLTIYTENGLVTAAGTDGIVVPPGGQRILSLAGFAPDATSPVVRVQSTGSQVVANLQQSIVRTLEPGGVDVIGAAAAPAEVTVIPGLVLSTTDAIAAHENAAGYGDLAPIIRFFVPGSKAARTEITITPEAGAAKPTVVKMTLAAGTVTETPLGAFPAGSYTVTVRSDVPLVAAGRTSVYGGVATSADANTPPAAEFDMVAQGVARLGAAGPGTTAVLHQAVAGSGNVDFAWFASAPAMKKRALVVVGNGPSPRLHLANPTDADATVTVKQSRTSTGEASGADQTVTIPAGGAVTLAASTGISYGLGGFDRLMVSVDYSSDGALAAYTVSPTGPASQPIEVYRG